MNITTKAAGVAGVVWAAANAGLGFSTGKPPALDASGTEIAGYLSDHRGVYLATAALFGATLPLLFVFTGALRERLHGVHRSLVVEIVAPAGAILGLGTALAYVVLLPFVLGDGLGRDATDGIVRYAYVLVFAVTMIANIGGAALIAATSIAFSARARAGSLVVAGLVAVSCVGGLASPELALLGGLGFAVIAVWSIAVGIGMIRTQASAHEVAFGVA